MLKELRKQLDVLNLELVDLIQRRTEIVRKIAKAKREEKLPITDPQREEEIKSQVRHLAIENGVSQSLMEELIELLIQNAKEEQSLQ